MRQKDVKFLFGYFNTITTNIQIDKLKHSRLPEIHNNVDLVTEFFATGTRPEGYCDSSSIVLSILLEICVIFDSEELFLKILSFIDIGLSLQIVSIDLIKPNTEKLLFEKYLHNEYYVECIERTKKILNF